RPRVARARWSSSTMSSTLRARRPRAIPIALRPSSPAGSVFSATRTRTALSTYRAPVHRHTTQSEFDLGQIAAFPKVTILYSYSGDDDDLAKAAVAAGAKGLVIAGTGAGHANNARKTLKELYDTAGVIVVRSARVGAGRVIRDDNWQELGFVAADNLLPQKARILLQLGLTRTANPDELQRMFDEY